MRTTPERTRSNISGIVSTWGEEGMAADAVCMTVTAAGGETELPVQATNVKQVAARTTGTDRVDFFIAHLSGREGMRVPT